MPEWLRITLLVVGITIGSLMLMALLLGGLCIALIYMVSG